MDTNKITVSTTLAADRKKVWDLWTKPEHITRWNYAIDSWHCPSAENELKPGGKYKARMEAKDGSMGFDFEAIYDEVVNEKKLSYTMGDGRNATTTFEDAGGATKVTTIFDPETQNPAEMQKAGWQAIMDNFKKYAEEN